MNLKLKLKNYLVSSLLMSLTLKRYIYIYIYIPPFKKNNEEELKANIAKIDKGKKLYVDTEISKPMSKSSPRLQENMNLSSLVIIIMLLVILGQIVLS